MSASKSPNMVNAAPAKDVVITMMNASAPNLQHYRTFLVMHVKLKELSRLLRRKPRSTENILVSYADIVRRFPITRWRILNHPSFPKPPCTKDTIERWLRAHPAVPNHKYLEDVKRLKAEGLTNDAVAWKLQLGIGVVDRLWRLARRASTN